MWNNPLKLGDEAFLFKQLLLSQDWYHKTLLFFFSFSIISKSTNLHRVLLAKFIHNLRSCLVLKLKDIAATLLASIFHLSLGLTIKRVSISKYCQLALVTLGDWLVKLWINYLKKASVSKSTYTTKQKEKQ